LQHAFTRVKLASTGKKTVWAEWKGKVPFFNFFSCPGNKRIFWKYCNIFKRDRERDSELFIKEVERNFRKQHPEIEEITEACAILDTNHDNLIVHANDAFISLTEQSRESVLGYAIQKKKRIFRDF
jgi:hypothetical protein